MAFRNASFEGGETTLRVIFNRLMMSEACRLSPDRYQNRARRQTSKGAMYGRCPRCKRNLTISEAFGCGHVFGLT